MKAPQLDRLADALDLALALHAAPDRAAAALAPALTDLGRPQTALAHLERAIREHPDDPTTRTAHAQALRALGSNQAALASLERALAIAPDWPEALANHGLLLLDLGRPDAALASLDQALARQPKNVTALLTSGDAALALGHPADALARFDHAIALRPHHAQAHRHRATALNELDRLEDALAALRRAAELEPAGPEDRFHAALTHLALGDYRAGWREFEQRWNLPDAQPHRPRFQPPLWRGETDLAGRRILLYHEQGMGDTLQFCRYAPLLAARGATVLLRAPEPLHRLLRTLDGVSQVLGETAPLPPFDLHCPLMSLPLACGTLVETIPAAVPYLRADPTATARWRERLQPLQGLRVGLVWSGNPRPDEPGANAVDRRRSTGLARLAPLAAIPGVSFVSLQKGAAAAQAASPPAGMALHDWTAELTDFADTAALVAALDLVISVDTSVVHLAGALARPVWVLNRFAMCWRWLRGRTGSPWYPTARLFRQPAPGDWDSVIAQVAAALAAATEPGATKVGSA